MLKIPSASQIRALDAYTIAHEPIASIDLMERACAVFVKWFAGLFPLDHNRPIAVFCGPGNNGGDGLAIARMLHELGYEVSAHRLLQGQTPGPDHLLNFERLRAKRVVPIADIETSHFPALPANAIAIDALLGSGLNRPAAGTMADLINWLNTQPATRVAVDLPSGLYADAPPNGPVLQAHYTLSFQFPKPAFLLPATGLSAGQWHYADIGLSPDGIRQLDTPHYWVDAHAAASLWRPRHRFDHKGTFGHALLIAGSYGKVGAAILACRGALRAGAGLVTAHLPRRAYEIMQMAFPEAMVEVDPHHYAWSETGPTNRYAAIGLGPGLGLDPISAQALHELLKRWNGPLVIDADGLNLLSLHPQWLNLLPPDTILTPHPKEFERLFGPAADDWARLALLRRKARETGVIIVLKMAYTITALPSGELFFNSTGNPGMGTAGTGDVLTGIITGLLAQGYPPADAARLGVYLHGRAGDLAADALQQECLIADDLLLYLGGAFKSLKTND